MALTQKERGQLSFKVMGKIESLFKKDKNITPETLKNHEEFRDIYEQLKQEYGDKADEKLNQYFKSAVTPKKRNKNQTSISIDDIKNAVNECVKGQCELLDSIVKNINAFKQKIEDLESIKAEISAIKERMSQEAEKDDTSKENVYETITKLEEFGKKLNELNKKIESIPSGIKETVSGEINGIAKETLAALASIREEVKKEIAQDDKSKQHDSQELHDKQSEIESDKPMTLKEIFTDDVYRKVAIKEIEDIVKEKPDVLTDMENLINRCRGGDAEACEIIGAKSSEGDKLAKIEEQIENLKKMIEKSNEAENQEVKENHSKVIKFRSPLKERLFGGK